MKKRVADIIIETLLEEGITDCFAVVGGGAIHIDNALATHNDMNKVFCHHEQACAMAAEGYAKVKGKPAIVSVTSGPGALNTLNGVEGAYVDSVPMVIIAGHPRWDTTVNATGLRLRCRGVQEFDIVPAVKGMTKYTAYVLDPLKSRSEVKRAIRIAMEGRRGPVWLSIPLDVQSVVVNTEDLYCDEEENYSIYTISPNEIRGLNEDIKNSKRPVILPGSGIRTGGVINEFRQWVKTMNIPVVAGSLLPDIMYEGAKNYYGTSGSLGERRGNFILQNADLIIAIGNSLASKQTGFNQKLFAPYAKIVMIDADADEGKKPGVKADRFIHSDVKTFFESIKSIDSWEENREWITYCDSLKDKLGDIDKDEMPDPSSRVPSHYMWNVLREKMPDDMMIALGNNAGMQNCIQKSVLKPEQVVVVNYNSGSMGDDIPEAVGMYYATHRDVLCVTGDGSIMMNIQELQTVKHYNIPLKIIILSNDGYGALRQTYKSFFDGCYIGCDRESGVSFPDFEKVVNAFDIPFKRCKNSGELEGMLDWLLNQKDASVLEVLQRIDDPSSPKLMSKMNANGTFETPALQDLTPLISENLMKELMPKWK